MFPGNIFGIGGCGDGLRRENSALLMMSVAAVNAGPAVDDDLRAERANHADHVLNETPPQIFRACSGVLA